MNNIEELKKEIEQLKFQLKIADQQKSELLNSKEELQTDYDYLLGELIDFRDEYIKFLELITKINITNQTNIAMTDFHSLAIIVNKYLEDYLENISNINNADN